MGDLKRDIGDEGALIYHNLSACTPPTMQHSASKTHHVHQIPVLNLPYLILSLPPPILVLPERVHDLTIIHRRRGTARIIGEVCRLEVRYRHGCIRRTHIDQLGPQQVLRRREDGQVRRQRCLDRLQPSQLADRGAVVGARVIGEDQVERIPVTSIDGEGVQCQATLDALDGSRGGDGARWEGGAEFPHGEGSRGDGGAGGGGLVGCDRRCGFEDVLRVGAEAGREQAGEEKEPWELHREELSRKPCVT